MFIKSISKNIIICFGAFSLIACGGGSDKGVTTPPVVNTNYTITLNVTGNGSVTTDKTSYLSGEIAQITITPDEQHLFVEADGCGMMVEEYQTHLTQTQTFSTGSLNANCTLNVNFAPRIKLVDVITDEALLKCAKGEELSREFADEVSFLSCTDTGIKSTSGIENLIHLAHAQLDINEIEQIDLSNNKQLVSLRVDQNKLTSLDVTNNNLLNHLTADFNEIAELDLSNAPFLITLSVYSNKIEQLELSTNPALTFLNLGSNLISSIDLSNNNELISLYAESLFITEISLDNLSSLKSFSVDGSNISSIDFSNNLELERVNVGANPQLTQVDVSMLTNLKDLFIEGNLEIGNFTTLDVSQNTKLERLWLERQKFSTIDLSNNPLLNELDAKMNQLTSIDLSNNTALTTLDLRDNLLTQLDLTNNVNLEVVYFDNTVTCSGEKC